MTYIKKISMTGFKSFGERTVTLRLSSGFTCIVGPNGAGKSNIIDALTFALGRLSKKTMRAKSLEDLIFAGSRGKNPSNRASVTLYFDNSEKVFPGGTDTFEVTRTIQRGGGGGYKMNGKKATRQQILNALATANVDPDGSNQFVLQGKIVELTHMNPEARRVFIEDLIGLQKYDEMKDATMKELEKAERDLGQFEAIFKEVSAQLKKVEKEKNDALVWKELDEQIKLINAQLIALKIEKLRKEENELEAKIEESNTAIEELQEKITRQDEILKQESLVMENIQKTISEKEKEREAINENVTQFKTQQSSNQTSLNLANKSIDKISQEIKTLENLQMVLEESQTYDSLIESESKDVTETENKIESAKGEIETKQQKQAEIDVNIKNNNDTQSGYKGEISTIKQNISSNKAQIKVLKENVKKNEDKKNKLEVELSKLKGESESVEEAINNTNKEAELIRKDISELNIKISKENDNQKELEKLINGLRDENTQLNSKIADFKSMLSSLNTEITMNTNRIEKLNSNKIAIENKIKELSKGKDTEDVLKELLKERDSFLKEINNYKAKIKEEDSIYRKNEQELELLLMKQDSVESEIYDNKTKIENINTKLKLQKKEFTNLEREKRDLELKSSTLSENLTKTEDESQKLNAKKENIQRRMGELSNEKDNLLVKIENTEKEYERNTEDVTGILQILNMLTQNINISVESIKSNIQQSNAEAIETSAVNFKQFVLDIVDIMKTVEDVSSEAEEEEKSETSEMSETLKSILQTLTLFTENVDTTIDQLIDNVKESADVEIQQSTSTFDSFVQDLMEILENVYLSLRKLTMSKSQELYKQLEEITENINSQNNDLNVIDQNLTRINTQNKHDSEDLAVSTRRLGEVNKRISEINEKVDKSENEINQRNLVITEKQKENFEEEINNLKQTKEDYWDTISKIKDNMELKQKGLDNLQINLQELQGIQTYYENIVEIENNIQELNVTIDDKKSVITTTEENIKGLKLEQDAIKVKIEGKDLEKNTFWEDIEKLRAQIDEQNKKLEITMDKLRALENVMMVINSIDELTKENVEANNSVNQCKIDIENLNSQLEGLQKKVDDVQVIIDSLREEKNKELEGQKKAQKELNKLNKDLQKSQAKLNELNKNKEREQKILSLNEDVKTTEKQIESILKDIEKIELELKQEDAKKNIKQEEINKEIQGKDLSWKKQKNYQKQINDLKADHSMENSKLNNYESKKIITTDQIETLYQRSKDFGALPPVTTDLSESGLQSDISTADNKKKALEPVNLKAIKQFDTVKERFDEIDMRRQTIQRERKSILDAIDKIELEKTRTFMKAYHEINREFARIFQKLSPGGSAKMILDRPDKPFEGGCSIEARPRGKRISSLEILSGGEKTLVALSFIFAVQEFYPAPFYIMDEIDAALDGPNVHRVSLVIKEFASQAQFMVISHREENIVNADRIYGVSMQQSGITDIFSVDLEEEAKRLLELPDVPTNIEEN
ncbi:MAG: chromosome segregation protein SMC [Candidatus Lokiarchaeota archaeon]|nr:chromosome segregation protein SMC [Candidatus Lokiarchaeota archaeon]